MNADLIAQIWRWVIASALMVLALLGVTLLVPLMMAGNQNETRDTHERLAGHRDGGYVECVATTNQALTGLPTIDGVSPIAGERVLLTAQTAGAENGIWEVAAGAWARPTGYAAWSNRPPGLTVWVVGGTVFSDSVWRVVDGEYTIGTTALTFEQDARWASDGTDVWRASGNVGVGTASPAVPLHGVAAGEVLRIDGGTADSPYLSFHQDAEVGRFRYLDSSDDIILRGLAGVGLLFYSDNTFAAAIDTDQEFGIGTSTPTARLHVSGGTQSKLGNYTFGHDQAVGAGQDNYVMRWDNGGGEITLEAPINTEEYVNAGAMIPRTTNGAASATAELATNDIMVDSLDFDTTTVEGVGFWVQFPAEWDAGTVTVEFQWTGAAGAGGVTWGVAGRSFANDDALDQALGTRIDTDDTFIAADDMHRVTSAAVTIAGATAGEPVYFEVTRQTGDANDTKAEDAKLLAVVIDWDV